MIFFNNFINSKPTLTIKIMKKVADNTENHIPQEIMTPNREL